MITLKNPSYDLDRAEIRKIGDVSDKGIARRSYMLRSVVSATVCRFVGHKWTGTGYANNHIFGWHQWEIGRHHCCSRCQARNFYKLESAEQLEQVLNIEAERWADHFMDSSVQAEAAHI